ncbi:MAG: DUF2868 domain-containing protein [Verrucomicrobiaceae bacterium]|nr:DUF2868 domain-containing protein [Verrucomicrobiaceae bacterium]
MRWRAVEEADKESAVLSSATRRDASREVMEQPNFLAARAQWLSRNTSDGVRATAETLHVPTVPSWIPWVIVSVGLMVGYVLTELGKDGKMNLLALPLVSLLVWNAVVMIAALISEIGGPQTGPGWLGRWLTWGDRGGLKTFQDRAVPLVAARAAACGRAWLHLGAAALAMGSIAGLYAKGWSTEYRAMWESTLLNTTQVQALCSALFSPAARVFDLEVPISDIPAMQKSVGVPALPWIHLYAGTLLLFIVLPRLALALISSLRGSSRLTAVWNGMGWDQYEKRLKRAASAIAEHVWMVPHGWRAQDEQRDRWSLAVEDEIGAAVQTEYVPVPPGGEDEFVEKWQGQDGSIVVVFNAAATPEKEVQGRLLAELKAKFASGRVFALLDTALLHQRRHGSLEGRIQLWKEMLGTKLIVCGEEVSV